MNNKEHRTMRKQKKVLTFFPLIWSKCGSVELAPTEHETKLFGSSLIRYIHGYAGNSNFRLLTVWINSWNE